MSFERLSERGESVGAEVAMRARERLIARTASLAGVKIEALSDGIALSGERLRHRFITDPKLRNILR